MISPPRALGYSHQCLHLIGGAGASAGVLSYARKRSVIWAPLAEGPKKAGGWERLKGVC